MDDHTSGIGLFGYIILFVIIVWVFGCMFNGGGSFGFGGCGNRNAWGGYETLKEVFEGQKANIAQTATTQYLIEQQANATRDYLGTKIDFYEYQKLRDALREKDNKILQLENRVYNDAQFNSLSNQISSIRCNMLTKPEISGVGVACPSAAILNGLGVNSLSNCNKSCYENLV
jgi:hypothetical protein